MNKLEKINELLLDDSKLEKYINEIEKSKEPETKILEEKIISKINKKKKNKYADICKIAACLIFSLAICRTDFIIDDNVKKYEEDKPKNNITINGKLSDCWKWVTTPIEKEEK